MSLYGALFAGVSGLSSQSSAMGAISDNITNINTVGYKGTQVNFQTLVTKQVSSTKYSPGGVQSKPRSGIDVQGLLQATTSATDLGISGTGFFVVSDQATNASGFAYTRAGSYKVDKDGFLQNVGGYYLQGWPLENWDGTQTAATVSKDGNVYMKSYKNTAGDTYYMNDNAVDSVNLRPLNLSTIGGTARATSTLAMGAKLPAGADIGSTAKTNALIFDSLGNSHNMNYTWTKRAQNSWDVEVLPPAGSTYVSIDDQTTSGRTYFSAGRLDLTNIPAAGTSMTMGIGGSNYTFNFAAADSNITDNGGPNSSVIAGAAPGTIEIGGITFSMVNGTAGTDTEIDISGATTATEARDLMVQSVEAYFDGRYGGGNYVAASGAAGFVSSLTVANNTGSFGAPANTDPNGALGANEYSIDITGKSLSQILDQLAAQVNTAMASSMNVGATPFPPNPPGALAERVSGENGIWFRQFDDANVMTVDASGIVDSAGTSAVMQNDVYTIPMLSTAVAWTTTISAGQTPSPADDHYALSFNGDGSIDKIFGSDEVTANDPRSSLRIGWANGALNMDGSTPTSGGSPEISMFLGNYNTVDGFKQLSGDYQLDYLSQNGNKFGNFAGVSIGEDGIVTALFDNGVTTPIFMIPIATFVNPNGMNSLTGNVFQQTDVSGLPTVREAASSGAGAIAGAALESSTVDLAEEFTTMITTQRAYSAAAKIITTADEMLDELTRIKR